MTTFSAFDPFLCIANKARPSNSQSDDAYQSVHYLVRLTRVCAELAEYQRFARSVTEVQVRTILQHAWAEIEHDIQYKSSATIPRDIRRRFMALAGMLELADREFQAIQDQDAALNTAARTLVEQGKYSEVEITPTALKLYVDRRLGSDGRMSDFSYDWTVRLLKKLGFRTLNQIDECIANFDDDKISRLLTGTRQGQLTRFEYLILASMGESTSSVIVSSVSLGLALASRHISRSFWMLTSHQLKLRPNADTTRSSTHGQ